MVRKKKKEPEQQGNEELFLALGLLEKERGIPVDFMLDRIKRPLPAPVKRCMTMRTWRCRWTRLPESLRYT